MDEPLSALDDTLKFQIIPFLKNTCEVFQIPYLFISHSLLEMRIMTDQLLQYCRRAHRGADHGGGACARPHGRDLGRLHEPSQAYGARAGSMAFTATAGEIRSCSCRPAATSRRPCSSSRRRTSSFLSATPRRPAPAICSNARVVDVFEAGSRIGVRAGMRRPAAHRRNRGRHVRPRRDKAVASTKLS